MPGIHLPRMPYDLFPYDFWGIVGGYGVWVYIDTSNVRFLVRTFGDGPGKTVRRPCGDRWENRAVSARKSYIARAASVRRPRGDGTVTARSSYSFGWPGLQSSPAPFCSVLIAIANAPFWARVVVSVHVRFCFFFIFFFTGLHAARSWCGRRRIATR